MSKFVKFIKNFPRTFWVANIMELFERWAWYGLFAVLALYLTKSTDEGALGFSQIEKGNILGIVTAILYFLPIVTGAVADRFGYKKVLLLSYIILSSGYFMMGTVTTYGAVFFSFLYVALGAALFKPVLSATIAKTTDKSNSSIGFGIFYMMVNIGGFIGPVIASKMRIIDWNYVFIMSGVSIFINFILLIFFYKEPERDDEDKDKSINFIFDFIKMIGVMFSSIIIYLVFFSTFIILFFLDTLFFFFKHKKISFRFANWFNTLPAGEHNKKIFSNITAVFNDPKFITFLLIIVGFWTMYNQILYTIPNFIDQWIDTKPVYDFFASIGSGLIWFFGSEGTVKPEIIVSFNAGFIIFFQIIVSAVVMRFKPVNSMISGIIVSAIGVGLAFATSNIAFVVLGIFIFALGEMATSPKITEYIGMIAPKEKIAIYMGYSFIPMAVGNFVAGILSGRVYQSISDKISLLQIEIKKRGLQIPEISKETGFTQNDYIEQACEMTKMSETELTHFLWETYNPSKIWLVFSLIGLITVIALVLYDILILKKIKKIR